MYIESRVRKVIENVHKMFWIIQRSPSVSSAEKIKSLEVQQESENLLKEIFDLGFDNKSEIPKEKIFPASIMNTKMTALAYDLRTIFETLSRTNLTANSKIDFIRPRTEFNLFKNKFNNFEGQILFELGNEKELFFLVQYDTGVYNIITEQTASIAK